MTSDLEKLARIIINYSCSIKAGEKVLINTTNVDKEFIKILIREINKVKAFPFLREKDESIEKEILLGYSKEYAILEAKYELARMQDLDAIINVRGKNNLFEMSDVPQNLSKIRMLHFSKPIYHDLGLQKKWVLLNYPGDAYAQQAEMSTEKFKQFFFEVCTLDYSKMDKAMDPLKELMDKTDKVRLVSKGTDISFSIKGVNSVKCSGQNNIPDGELYTAPVKSSVNGVITFNVPTIKSSIKFDGIKLEVKDGKIIKATANNNTKALNEILDTDEGSRYFGEFSIGLNPYITKPILDILFDEKMVGSIHFTPGSCYEDASNGNKSAVHWDMVLSHMPEYGGGEIYFDDVLIRKDGKFVLEELLGLNPENLK